MGRGVVAIVPAAGSGKRFGAGIHKQFISLAGKPVLIWALETLAAVEEIIEIIPVVKEDDMAYCAALVEDYGISKVRRIAPGGRERQDSVFQGLKLVENRNAVVLVHDGVRPLAEGIHIKKAIAALDNCDGVVIGVPVKDTIKEAEQNVVAKTLQRGRLWAAQTPQVFNFQALYGACLKAEEEYFYATDDAALVERYGGKIKMEEGSYMNIKVTTPEDLQVAELFLQMLGRTA